jgi:hypothetical protein
MQVIRDRIRIDCDNGKAGNYMHGLMMLLQLPGTAVRKHQSHAAKLIALGTTCS